MCCSPGRCEGEELARAYASADVFVFPSLTDTFGLVLLEALASGVPVAAFPVRGPKDVLTDPCCRRDGLGSWKAALAKALTLDRHAARAHALRYSWENSARQFIENVLAPIIASCRSGGGAGAAIGKRKRPGWGGTGPLHSHASVWGTLGGSRVLPEMVSKPLKVQEPPSKILRRGS